MKPFWRSGRTSEISVPLIKELVPSDFRFSVREWIWMLHWKKFGEWVVRTKKQTDWKADWHEFETGKKPREFHQGWTAIVTAFVSVMLSGRIYYSSLGFRNNTNVLSCSSGGQMFETAFTRLKWRCQQGCIPSRGSKRESVSLPFLASRGHLHSLFVAPPSSKLLKISMLLTSHLFLLLWPFYLPLRLHWVHWIISFQDPYLFTYTKSLFGHVR